MKLLLVLRRVLLLGCGEGIDKFACPVFLRIVGLLQVLLPVLRLTGENLVFYVDVLVFVVVYPLIVLHHRFVYHL
jgi:hypothetical protein